MNAIHHQFDVVWLLCTHCKRPSDRRAAKKRDEVAPSHRLFRSSGQGIVAGQSSPVEGGHVRFG